MDTEAVKRKSPYKLWMRILAVILVIANIGNLVLFRMSNVTLDADEQETGGAKAAAEQLYESNEYANTSRAGRMLSFLRSLLGKKKTYEEYELAAQIAIAQAKYAQAIGLTEKEIAMVEEGSPEEAELCLRQGYLYTIEADYANALTWLQKGIALNPTPEAVLTRAQVYLNLGDTGKAMEDVDAFLEMSEDTEDVLPYLVNVYESAGDYETAAEMYSRLIAKTPAKEFYLGRAYCCTNLGRMEEAQADRDSYAGLGGEELGTVDVMLGVGWLRAGEYGKANSCFVHAQEENVTDQDSIRYYVVMSAYINGDYAVACEYGAPVIEKIRSGEMLSSTEINMEPSTGKLQVKLVDMNIPSMCLMTGASYMRLGEYEKAKDCLDLYLDYDDTSAYVRYLRASCLLALGQYEEALPDFDLAIESHEEEEGSRYGRAVCRIQMGDTEEALEDLDWILMKGTDEELFNEAAKLSLELLEQNPEEG